MPDKDFTFIEATIDVAKYFLGLIGSFIIILFGWLKIDIAKVNKSVTKAHERIDEQQKEIFTKEDLKTTFEPLREDQKIILNHILNQPKGESS